MTCKHCLLYALVCLIASPSAVSGGDDQRKSASLPVDELALLTASAHPMKFYLALPRGYRKEPGKRWPVLIGLEGAYSDFQKYAEAYRKARGDLPVLIAAPCTSSNTNAIEGEMRAKYLRLYDAAVIDGMASRAEWDAAGLAAVMRDLREQFDAEERFYVTGFSGGGLPAYRMIFEHPERVAGAALVCANFFGDAPPAVGSPGRPKAGGLAFPIHQLIAEQDPFRPPARGYVFVPPGEAAAVVLALAIALGYMIRKRAKAVWPAPAACLGIVLVGGWCVSRLGWEYPGNEGQNDRAAQILRERGYSNVSRTVLPGRAHFDTPEEVVAIFQPDWQKSGSPH